MHGKLTVCVVVAGLYWTGLGCDGVLQSMWSINQPGDLFAVMQGFSVFEFDPANQVPLSSEGQAALASSTHALSSLPPLALPLYDPALSAKVRLLKECGENLAWLGYLSSTSVYGDHQGALCC